MATNYEPCSICEEYIEGVACTKDQCPVAKMKAENERLEKRLKEEKHALFEQQAYTAKLQAEIERLEGESNETFHKWEILAERTKDHYAELYEEAKEVVRAKAIKEFAERLKESISNMEYTANIKRKTVSVETLYTQVNWVFHEIVPKTIDKLVKELAEVKDGNV